MISFKKYISEQPLNKKQKLIRPQDMELRQSETGEKQVDFDDPAYTHQFKRAVKDSENWPPKPAAKYKADQIRWAVTAGKQPEHLANES